MKEQAAKSTKLVVDFEDSLLCLHRERFFLRTCVFVSSAIMTVLYRLVPARGVIIGSEMAVITALWVWAAINAKRESQVYNDYVKSMSPLNAQQLGLKPAPIRGFFSFFLKSWDVTCFFAPFLFFVGFLLLSPCRNLDGYIAKDMDLDKYIETNRLCRVNYITNCATDRLRTVEKSVSEIKSWAKAKIKACREKRADVKEENASTINQDNSRWLKSSVQ